MPYKNIVFAKLERRLFNDYRWYMMSEEAQLNYIRFILFASETYNKIPKNIEVIKKAFKTDQDVKKIALTIEEIKINFPKFKEGKHFYYFEGFSEKTNYIPEKETPRKSRGLPKLVVDIDIDKEKEIEKKGGKPFTPPTLNEVKEYCIIRKNNVDFIRWHNFYSAKGWMVGRNKMKDWKASVRTWENNKTEINNRPKTNAEIAFERP